MQTSRRSFGLVLATVALWTSTILVSMGAVGTFGCSPATQVGGRSTANLTAPGVQALHLKEVVKYLDVVRDTAVDAEASHLIPTPTTEAVVRWHRAAVTTIGTAPAGWKATVLTGLQQLQASLTPAEHQILDPYLLAAETIIQAVIA